MKIIYLILIITFSSFGNEKLPKDLQKKLLGTWVSDREKTTEFNKKHSILKPKQMEFLSKGSGHLVLEYKKGNMVREYMPKYSYILGGKEIKNDEEWEETKPYKILGYTESSIIIESENQIFGKMIFTIQFEDDNTYWIYLSGNMFNLHAREYFKKIKKK